LGFLAKPVNRRWDFFSSRDGQGYKFFIHYGSEISTPHGYNQNRQAAMPQSLKTNITRQIISERCAEIQYLQGKIGGVKIYEQECIYIFSFFLHIA